MVKKLVLIALISLVIGFADEYLVRVELTENRLTPLFERGVSVIGELKNSAIILIDSSNFERISSYSFEVLDSELQEGSYYFVRPLDSQIDVSNYGEILTKDGDDYLIKIKATKLDQLIQEVSEEIEKLADDPEKPLTKNERTRKIVLQLQSDTLKKIKAAKEKGNLQQEIRAGMDYATLKRFGEKHPFLMNFIKSQIGWYGW